MFCQFFFVKLLSANEKYLFLRNTFFKIYKGHSFPPIHFLVSNNLIFHFDPQFSKLEAIFYPKS